MIIFQAAQARCRTRSTTSTTSSENALNVLLKRVFDPSVVELDFDSLQLDGDDGAGAGVVEGDYLDSLGLPSGFEME